MTRKLPVVSEGKAPYVVRGSAQTDGHNPVVSEGKRLDFPVVSEGNIWAIPVFSEWCFQFMSSDTLAGIALDDDHSFFYFF